MKKQLLIKKNRSLLPRDVRQVLTLVKNMNKQAVFFTKNSIILNPVMVFGQNFLVIQITDSYKIIIKKQQWKLPDYATQNIQKIGQVMQASNKQRPGNFIINIRRDSIQYIIPMTRLISTGDQSYYRMNFYQVFKQTSKRISYNRFCQVTGKPIKPIFCNKNIKSFVSTSPILQATIFYDKKTDKFTYMLSKYIIDVVTGQIIKAVQKAFQQGRKEELSAIQNALIKNCRKQFDDHYYKNVKFTKEDMQHYQDIGF